MTNKFDYEMVKFTNTGVELFSTPVFYHTDGARVQLINAKSGTVDFDGTVSFFEMLIKKRLVREYTGN